ncbi:helix-turn-helix domain-containing protein [Nocardioides kongjuensis]|uniref:Transcriptional regulator with XRE-family HTH domain n=1 Tax=Nocardioides kongjuensis TaxID=349522 RepID=A0A852RTY4_9ACTN|nr:helix-turn-helix transcriptional regulator [Nocardioides kongjuensis]NYD32686.1 transcriptional regulator with XRE-family HTH domain [Nocardioides kongjuensis]
MPRQSASPERLARARRLGSLVRTLREQRGLSRERLARLADVSTETIRKIESGATASPEVFTFAAIMNHLDATIDDVLAQAQLPDVAPSPEITDQEGL